jgi:DNA helicase-2/ATP-dependent DNA helicase PcrA
VDQKQKKFQQDTVRLMTLHSAKGLEFPVVFLVGLELGLLPHSRSMHAPAEMMEERRLFYVGMTRACKHLVLSMSAERTVRGRSKQCHESPFLQEIPPEYLRFQTSQQNGLEEDENLPIMEQWFAGKKKTT